MQSHALVRPNGVRTAKQIASATKYRLSLRQRLSLSQLLKGLGVRSVLNSNWQISHLLLCEWPNHSSRQFWWKKPMLPEQLHGYISCSSACLLSWQILQIIVDDDEHTSKLNRLMPFSDCDLECPTSSIEAVELCASSLSPIVCITCQISNCEMLFLELVISSSNLFFRVPFRVIILCLILFYVIS